MSGAVDLEAWARWLGSLNAGWLFLVILALVVAVVAVWSARSRHGRGTGSGIERSQRR